MDICDFCYEVNGSSDCENCYIGNPCLGCIHYNRDCKGQCYVQSHQNEKELFNLQLKMKKELGD